MDELIGEYEVAYTPDAATVLVIHHLVRGYDVVRLDADGVATLRALFTAEQKAIQPIGPYQVITGASGDISIYEAAAGKRACYFNADQVQQLRALLG